MAEEYCFVEGVGTNGKGDAGTGLRQYSQQPALLDDPSRPQPFTQGGFP